MANTTDDSVLSPDDLFCKDTDIAVKEAELPVVIEDEVDCNTFSDYDWPTPSFEEINRPDVQLTSTSNLDVGPPYRHSRFRQRTSD